MRAGFAQRMNMGSIAPFGLGFLVCGVGCSGAPHANNAALKQAAMHEARVPVIALTTSAAKTSALPPAPSGASEVHDTAPVGTFRGNDPFAPPPSGPAMAYPPPPARPPGTDPDDPSRAIKQCAEVKSCGACNNWGYCGYCAANRTCVPKDKHGPYPGTCPGGYTPNACEMTFYFEEEEPKLRKRLAEYMSDLRPEGMPFDRNALKDSSLSIPVSRGKCYGATFRVSHDADGRLNPEATVDAKFIGYGGNWAPIYTDTYAVTPFCPQQSGRILVTIKPEKATRGTWRVQLFSAPIAEAELRRQMDEYETEMRQRMVQTACSNCAQSYAACLLDGAPRCKANYLVCLANAHLTPDDCERGDVLPKPPEKDPKQARLELFVKETNMGVAQTDGSSL